MPEASTGPLVGLRVLDLTSGVAGPYCTKLLADYGAEVLKVEPPGGDPARREAPFFQNEPGPDRSALFLQLNTNKRSIVLDIETSGGQAHVRRLMADADVIVEDFAPGFLAERGCGYDAMESAHPGVILASVTPWGQSGPYIGLRQSDIVAQAMGGPMLWTGSGAREPLKLGGALSHHHAGAAAAVAILMAVYRHDLTGEGDHIDVSIYEVQAASRDRAAPYLQNHIYNGMEPRRQAAGITVAVGVRPCLDGYVNINATGTRLPAFLRMIGREDLVGDPRTNVPTALFDPALATDIEASYLGWLMQRTKREVVAAAQAAHLLAGAINTPQDLVEDPHYRERGAWEVIDHPVTGPIEYPGRPFVMSDSPRPIARRAPLLGEHTDAVLREIDGAPAALGGSAHREVPRHGRASGRGKGRLPLEGIRVADVTAVWAGPYVGQLLAEWGADVIRVEPLQHVQATTRGAERPISRDQQADLGRRGIAAGGGYPDFEPGPRPWNRNSGFNSHARNKRSITADLMSDEGREIFYRLIAHCDVFIENNVPETIERARVTYEDLVQIKPDLIQLRMPAFGLSGPYKNYRALGTHIEGMIGHHYVRGYPAGLPDEAGDVYTGDAMGGVQGALAVMMALHHRNQTGRGQQIELSQAENFLPVLGAQILQWTMNHEDPGPQGNQHPSHAPHQAYPCRGDDEWIAIDVASDEEFAALCDVLRVPHLVEDARFADQASRWAHRAELDASIADSTREAEKFELFRALQAAGVTAGPLQKGAERLACPQLNERGFFEVVGNADTGPYLTPGLSWRMARTPNRLRSGPAMLGEHNEEILQGLLGYSVEEYQSLWERGVIGDGYAPEVIGWDPASAYAERNPG